jgi:ribosomal protein S18 acetylase RimI-like enzyme
MFDSLAMTDRASPAKIRRATLDDTAALAELGAATFTEAFGHLYPLEDAQTFLASAHVPETWRRTLTEPKHAVWVAELADQGMIGYICVGPCKLPVVPRESTAGEVRQLYVLAHFHNLRLGTRLMDTGLDWLDSAGQVPVYVGVWSGNDGAQRFYGRYGFRRVGEYGFPVGKTVDREFILKR